MRSPPQAPQNDSTGEFADLDGVGMALQAKAAQALPGILVGQIEAPLQVLSGRLLHVQLLCVLLVKEADFLPKKRGEWSVKSPASCLAFTPQFPRPAYQPMVLPHFPVGLQGKARVRAGWW